MLISIKEGALQDLENKIKNLKHLRENFSTTTLIKPSAGNWPFADGVSGCSVCGMACTDYALHVELVCGHIFCFQICMENLQCYMCKIALPANLYLELGYSNYVADEVKNADASGSGSKEATDNEYEDSTYSRPEKLEVRRRPQTRSMCSPKKVQVRKTLKKETISDIASVEEIQTFANGRGTLAQEETEADGGAPQDEPTAVYEATTQHTKLGRKRNPKRLKPPAPQFEGRAAKKIKGKGVRKVKNPKVVQKDVVEVATPAASARTEPIEVATPAASKPSELAAGTEPIEAAIPAPSKPSDNRGLGI